jgi:cytoskeletal protein RodZ
MKRKKNKNQLIKKKSTLNKRINYYKEIKNLLSKKIAYFYLGLITTFVFIFILVQISFPILKSHQNKIISKNNKNKTTPQTSVKGETSSLETNNHSYYIVKEGDYLWKIAETVYGDGNYWIKIVQANKITDPNILIPGTKLIIPR